MGFNFTAWLFTTGGGWWVALILTSLLGITESFASIQTTIGYRAEDSQSPAFTFTNVPSPSRNDAATKAVFTIISGDGDANGGGLEKLHDGKLPFKVDDPAQNFFFVAGTSGGRIQVDLASPRQLQQVNTYSWHPTSRGPQVYQLYASAGTTSGFNAKPGRDVDPLQSGWNLIAKVDTRGRRTTGGGQCGVSIADTTGVIGSYRYLLFDIMPTETDDDFGNTFFSEIDVVELNAPVEPALAGASAPIIVTSADSYCQITIDTTQEPALRDWAQQKLAPALTEWYPKIVAMMPSEGYRAPREFRIVIRPMDGVAFTSGTRITANSVWLGGEITGEALGAIIHEMVHVVQQYRGGRNHGQRAPGWLVEGIPDYIRFFKFEPQSHGADNTWLQRHRNPNLKYDGMYRISANFLNYVIEHYDPNNTLLKKVNAACREGSYSDTLWPELTGKSLPDLNEEWKAAVSKLPAG